MNTKNNTRQSVQSIIYILIIVVLVGGIAYLGMRANSKKAEKSSTPTTNTNTMNTPTEGLQYEVIQEGNGAVVGNGDVAVVNYTGRLQDGTVFDSNVDPAFRHATPFEFTVGAGHVIKGWDLGVAGMKIGEKRRLTLAPEMAYGSRGAGALIPPNSTLIFDVELTGILHD